MKKTSLFIATIGLAVIVLLATCQKGQKTDEEIQEVTYSKNFNSGLTDANIWFDFVFEFHNATSNQTIASKKEIAESFYSDLLYSTEKQTHELYFKWINISQQPLKYRLISYVTPAPVYQTAGGGRTLGNDTSDPPPPPPPPPPPM